MAINISDSFQAAGTVDGVPLVPLFAAQRGFLGTITRPAAVGVYDLNLDRGLDQTAGIVHVQASGPVPIIVQTDRPGGSDTVIRVSLFTGAGAPVDGTFAISVHRFDL